MKDIQNAKGRDYLWGFRRDFLAIGFMMLGSSFFALGFIYCNQQKFHPSVSGFVRGFTVSVVCWVIARHQKIDLVFGDPRNFKWQLLRNGIMALHGLIYAWSLFYLPLPIVVTLNSSSPIFAAFFDRVIYGTLLNRPQLCWLLVAFSGVILTANGTYIQKLFSEQKETQIPSADRYFTQDPVMMLIAGLILASIQCLHGYGIAITKEITNTNSIQINYFVGIIIMFSSAFLIPTGVSDPLYYNPKMIDLGKAIVFSGIPLAIGMLGYNGALTVTNRYTIVTPFQFTAILVGYLVSIVRYDESVNIYCVLGAIAIALGVIFILLNHPEYQRNETL